MATDPDEAPAHHRDGGGRRRRLVGVDAFRGFVLAVMVLTPVTGENGSYPLLGHAPWNGFTVADAILPAFLVTSGASLAFLLRPPVTGAVRLRLVRRTIALVVLGVLYNAWGHPGDLSQVRLTGVLQLIGVAGAMAAGTVLVVRRVTSSPVPLMLLAAAIPLANGVYLAMADQDCTVDLAGCSPHAALDRTVLGARHLYAAGAAGFDPEGVAVMVAASSLVLVGFLVGDRLRQGPLTTRTLLVLVGAGAALVAVGLALDPVQPVNKRLHTPAFSALSAGIGVLGLVLSVWATDAPLPTRVRAGATRAVDAVRRVAAHPFETLGRNALVVFLAERLILTGLDQTTVTTAEGPRSAAEVLLHSLVPVEGVRVHLAYTGLVLAMILAVTYAMRVLRWRIAL